MGCASVTTWNHTGITIYTVNHAEVKKTANGEIELLQNVTLKKMYLPYVSIPLGISDLQQIRRYTTQKKPENAIAYTFRLRPDKKQPVRVSKLNGFLYFNETLSSGKPFVNKLNPADIALMKENPFVIRFLSPTGRMNHFLIPYAIKQENSGEIRLQCYTPLTPRVIFPYEQNNTYQEKMNGAGITLLRIAMLPIPIIVDTATAPIQFLLMCLLHNGC